MADHWTALHLFCGLGGGALGFQRAGFRSVGAFDLDPEACRDFEYLTGEPATCADLAQMSPQELRDACTGAPDVLFTSPPCKGNSGCLSAALARTEHYQLLNSHSLRGVWLALEAWPENPPKLILLENVPKINSRSRRWLNQLTALLQSYGYAVQETTHDCGELGSLAQHRRRFLLVARHMEGVGTSNFLRVPTSQRVRGVGEVLGQLPMPIMLDNKYHARQTLHYLPRLSPMNWLRLALIPAGKDWNALPRAVALKERKARQNGGYGVTGWNEGAHAVIGHSNISCAWSSVGDPRLECGPRRGAYGVKGWDEPGNTVIGAACHDNSAVSVADPRTGMCPRRDGSMGVKGWDHASTTIIANGSHHNGPWQVADPRIIDPTLGHEPRCGGHRVEGWLEPSHTIIGEAQIDKGFNIADPRVPTCAGPPLDLDTEQGSYVIIRAADGTWHRPMTTLELAALQGLPTEVNGKPLMLAGNSHKRWRQRIGNAVPPPAAEAIARECLAVLEGIDGAFRLSAQAIWVTPDGEPVQARGGAL